MTQADRKKRSSRKVRVTQSPTTVKMKAILQKEVVRVFLAELMSTYVMMVFGLGSVAHMILGDKFGSYLAVNLGFGFGVTMGIHVAGKVSGAHMNAAVTFTNCALGYMPWKKFPVYILGQFLGSFLAAGTIYCLFYTLMEYTGGHLTVTGSIATASIFATYLPAHMTLWRGFLDEMFVTGMLQLCLFAITDKRNHPALEGTQSVLIGILVVILGVSLGMNSGYAINPSRDLPPRFFTFIAGWGTQVFSARQWWWVPVVAPTLGALLGGIIYVVFIGSIIPRESQRLDYPVEHEDHRITVPPKTISHQTSSPTLASVSVSPDNRPTVRPTPHVNDTIRIHQF